MNISDVKFAKSGNVNLAYQRYGAGPDVVIIPPLVSNVELGWEQEVYRRTREHIGRYVRVLDFDKRGIGSSDRFTRPPTLEERIGDITAVMDAEGVERASLLGLSEGGLMAQLFAAMHPERVDRLVLMNSGVGLSAYSELQAYSDTPIYPLEELRAKLWSVAETWGRDPQVTVDLFCPSQSDNPAFIRWMGRFQRQTASPADFQRQLESVVTLDANEHLPEIKAPTLVVNVTGDRIIHPAMGRYLAEQDPRGALRRVPRRRPHVLDHADLAPGDGLLARVRDRHCPRRTQPATFRDRPLHRHRRVDDPSGARRRRRLAHDHGWSRSCCLARRRRASRQARQEHRRRAAS